ncbi:hypothetical protein CAJAP_08806 [Camponotus japonicus]
MEGIKSPIKILAIRRLNRRIINHLRPAIDQQTTNAHSSFEDTLTSPSYSVEITFEGQKLPTYATLYYIRTHQGILQRIPKMFSLWRERPCSQQRRLPSLAKTSHMC